MIEYSVKEGIVEILPNLELPPNPKILDVGIFGRWGINGSKAIVDNFYGKGEIIGMSYKNKIPKQYNDIKHIEGDYFSHKITDTFDLIYFDLGWEGQLRMIETELETIMYNRLNKKGYLIFYMFNTSNYTGSTSIQNNLNNFWGTSKLNTQSIIQTINNLNSKYKLKFINRETHRASLKEQLITWITLQK
jgi:hypothetical protein